MQFIKRAISVFVKMGIAHFLFQHCAAPNVENIPTSPSYQSPYIVVLGTAQDAGYPQVNCRKDCCQQVWSGEREAEPVSCLGLIDPQRNLYWLFDATPSIVEQCQQVEELHPGAQLAGIFLTHAHIGHYTGLMMLGREAQGAEAIPTYVMPRMRSFLESNGPWSQLVTLKNIDLKPLRKDSLIQLAESLSVLPIQVPHRDEFSETVGFKISGQQKSALFIPDIDKWEKWERDIKAEIAVVDYAFLDGTFYKDGEIPGRDMSEIPHPFIQESMRYFENLSMANRQKIFFIHLNHTNPLLWSSDDIEQFKSGDFGLAFTGQSAAL